MNTVFLTSAYLAPVWYYTKLYAYKQVCIEKFDNYIKQTYRNRCIIATADGPLALTIPVEKGHSDKCLMKDLRISEHGHWRHVHWNALVSAYRNSPFFEYYADDFFPFYDQQYVFLWDYNFSLCQLVCKLLELNPCFIQSDGYRNYSTADFRDVIHPKHDFATDSSFNPIPYYQVFKDKFGFIPNLSIVDLLFNMGPEGLVVLRDSITNIP